jgi:hypothetical protein
MKQKAEVLVYPKNLDQVVSVFGWEKVVINPYNFIT